MKLLDPVALCRSATATPALNRGLAVLGALGERGSPLSLESLAASLRLPKASLFRLLETLQQLGLVRKNADKCYEPLWALQPLGDRRIAYRHRIESHFASICETTGCTVEWYEPGARGMTLLGRTHPDSERRVQAKPGFVREWGGEFEAVARLGYAFAPKAPPLATPGAYVSNGVFKTIPIKEARRQLADARARRTAADTPFNSNGVRRSAVAAFDESGQEFLGVLALAEVCHFSDRPPASSFLKHLLGILNT